MILTFGNVLIKPSMNDAALIYMMYNTSYNLHLITGRMKLSLPFDQYFDPRWIIHPKIVFVLMFA